MFFFLPSQLPGGLLRGLLGAAVLPRGQVHSVEMDPTVARLAQQVVQHAGLQQVVTVHVGHSEETPRGMG